MPQLCSTAPNYAPLCSNSCSAVTVQGFSLIIHTWVKFSLYITAVMKVNIAGVSVICMSQPISLTTYIH